MEIFTVGFTQKTAEDFFGRLKRAKIERLVDVRLNNSSQLAGFAKRDDLPFFLREICGADYVHEPLLAPTKEILDAYRKNGGAWSVYEPAFVALMQERQIEKTVNPELFAERAVLLCSEHEPTHCHRRLAAEYLQRHWEGVTITHL